MALPSKITREISVAGSRNPRWQVATLTETEQTAVVAVLAQFDEILRPATPDQIHDEMLTLVNHFRNDRTDSQWRLLGRDFIEDLAEFSVCHIRAVVREMRRTKSWFPKVADMRALLIPMKLRAEENRRRARVLLGLSPPGFLDVPADDEAPARDMTPVPVALNGMRVA